MRAFLAVFFVLSVLAAFSQNFVSPGIIAYHSGAYERTIKDMNKAFETSPNMANDVKAKAYYYRGMARLKLARAGSSSYLTGKDPYLKSYNDLNEAMRLDAKWRSSSQEEIDAIYQQLFNSAKNLYDQGVYAVTAEEVNSLLGSAVMKLSAAIQIRSNYDSNELLGKVYDAIGVFYDQLIDDQEARQKAISSYQSAVRYYEAALAINPQSLENVRALRQLSYRLGDREKEMKYAQMEDSIGG